MQITNIVLTTVIVSAPAIMAAPAKDQASVANTSSASASAADAANNANQQGQRELQACKDEQLWHPVYSVVWTNGYCREETTCDSPGYSTALACCKGFYGGQTSGACLKSSPNPPTSSPINEGGLGPTNEGGLDVWYPDYGTAWGEGGCLNERPVPENRPTYSNQLACCKGAYGGQPSGACFATLPSPPTTSPTTLPSPPTTSPTNGFESEFLWYPDYTKGWVEGVCVNYCPQPFCPNYTSQLKCCRGSYGGQSSGACLADLPSPPTTSPTTKGSLPELSESHIS